MPSYRLVPGKAQFKKEVGLPSWFSTVVCQSWCVRGLLETSKLEIFEANCGFSVGCTGKIEFVVDWNKTTVYVTGFSVGFVAARSFCAEIFAFRIGRSAMDCPALGFSYVRWKPRNGRLTKMGSFHQSKRLDNKWYAVEARSSIFIANLTFFLIP